jgi:hypothetical protein
MPEVKYVVTRIAEKEGKEEIIRTQDVENIVIRKICRDCNTGWMKRSEESAKPVLLELMHLKARITSLEHKAARADAARNQQRLSLSRWAVKAAFLLATMHGLPYDLPLEPFQSLRSWEEEGPLDWFVFASQSDRYPDGFVSSFESQVFPDEKPYSLRVGLLIGRLHLLVVIPVLPCFLAVRFPGNVHTPLYWSGMIQRYVAPTPHPTFSKPFDLLDYLTRLVRVNPWRSIFTA